MMMPGRIPTPIAKVGREVPGRGHYHGAQIGFSQRASGGGPLPDFWSCTAPAEREQLAAKRPRECSST